VFAFNGGERTLQAYKESLDPPLQVGIRQGFLGGLVVGITNGVAFFAYALALWYGSTRVEAGDYTGGDVVNVLFSALIGGFALGQAAPNVQYFQQGKVAGARIFEIMGRRPDIDFDADGGCCWGKEAALAVSWHWRSLPAGTAGRGPAGPTVPASGMATPPLPAAAQARF
jgi:ABC-type multidrug transport system fused ATPase/permease subunit